MTTIHFDELELALAECEEQVIELVTECEPIKNVPMEYNVSCWHCNPNRVTITPHPNPPHPKLIAALGFLDLRPTVLKPYDKKPVKRVPKGSVFKSFDKPKNYTSQNTKIITPTDVLYSRQRTFMNMFQVDMLNKEQFINYHRIMRSFMNELDYTPTDKQDVMLFYYQESCQDLYDVYMARRSPIIKKYAKTFEVNLENYDDVIDFMNEMRTYIMEQSNENDITLNKLVKFLKEHNPEHVYVDVKIVRALKQLKINLTNA